ncbi:hypothetical protein PTSG_11914 [Salpingoeca rosetta]|uniref:Integrase catalytic domain-containing protein n=1 Tax=Salpingoeca rosetta (strain ATCC 50818 / BSB-021) TaxID=946362 RepID=F2U353_SALR5|nr:uncharacterized protein PTSG_11914 [Salpingoeca rosetta]EGD82047.1 hypothetical protein PTSG_11914 [Salpingoeca rosetta]|eukprot:XP_004996230.1 hypothetical protein PTSG_11914 [Salpingoeca rosetta]
MELPPHFTDIGDGAQRYAGKVCRLLKPLYGLKQAGRAWAKKLHTFLKTNGWAQSNVDACLFTKLHDDGQRTWIITYVDDLIISGSSERHIRACKQQIKESFEAEDLGPLTWYLGLHLTSPADGVLHIAQTQAINDIINDYNLAAAASVSTPMRVGIDASSISEQPDRRLPFRNLVGSLLYLANRTRPDVSFACGLLCRYMDRYTTVHWQAAKHVLLYADIAGPLEETSLRGARYALTFIDDCTRFAWTFLIRHKNDVGAALEQLRKDRHVVNALRGATLQTDSDAVFKSQDFTDLCLAFDIKQRFSPPHSQAKNGSAERSFRTLFETARTMLFAADLDKPFWGFAVQHATLLHNIAPRRSLKDKSPFEALTGHAFDVSLLRVFGSPAYVHVEKSSTRHKLDPRSRVGVYVGFAEEDQAHVVWMPDTRRVVHTIHARFGAIKNKHAASSQQQQEQDNSGASASHANKIAQRSTEDSATGAPTAPRAGEPQLQPRALGGSVWDQLLVSETLGDKDTSGGSTTTCHVATSAAGTGEKISAVGGHLPDIAAGSVATSAEPATVKEALASPDSEEWRQAILDEFAAMQANDVYDVVPRADLPKGHKLLRSMVIFRRKRDDQGKVIKYKARWVAKGYSQVHGVNYTDTFAPTATIAAIRTMLAMAVARGMDIQQMDVNTAFLNAPVDHEIYVQPPAVDGIFSPNTVLRLKRGLYGLKQSPRLWNHTLDTWMREQDFVATATDACIYRRTCKGGKMMWVAVYVDDLLIFADSDSDMAAFKKAISKRFKMKDLGSPDICLGIKVQHDRKARTVTMSQEHYLRNVLETFGMADCKPVGTPLCTGYVDKPADKEEPLPDVPFRELLGSLLYAATMTRPDISAAVSILSRRMQHFGMDHWKAAKHLLRYIKGTLSYTIKYAATGDASNGSTADGVLSAYSDASFASDVDTRRSRTGFVVFCSTGPVSWNSKLQATVATASADAEYMALAATAQELMFLRQLQEELTGAVLCEPTLVHTDNQPAQRVAEHAASRMRHILVKYHYIRECVDTKRIVLSYLATEHMIADLLTKILPRPKTAQFCTMLFDQRPLPGCQPRARPHSGRSPRPSTPRQDL